MKLTKLTLLATAATFVLGISNTQAAIGTTSYYSMLNIKGTISTNAPEVSHGDSWKIPVKTVKYGNKQLLDLFADWVGADRSTDPWKHAKLVVGWDWSYDVLVVDKTRTNVLFDASDGVSGANFYLNFWYTYGVGAERGKDADPGYYAVVDKGGAYYYLYDNYVSLDYTSLWGYGGNQQSFMQTWDANGDAKMWKDSEMAKFPYSGSQYFQDYGSDTTSTANIKAKGKGKGYNYIGWGDF